MKNKNAANTVALGGILCAQAIAVSWLEGLIPAVPFMPPGAKPGLSNTVTMFAAGSLGLPQAMTITVVKALFAFLTRGATAGAMSLAGGALSTVMMWLMLRFSKGFGLVGISVLCAVCHNAAQLAVAAAMAGTSSVFYYIPVLTVFAVATGTLTGFILRALMPVLEKQKNHFIN